MKVQLDTTNKVIKLESSINLGEFVKKIKKLLPEDWEKFTLETNTTITYWSNPIVIKEYPYKPYWEYPYYTTVSGSTQLGNSSLKATYRLEDGVYNLEM